MSSNEQVNWTNWIEESIKNRHIKYYEYKHFSNIQEIGVGGFGKIYRANWKNSDQYLALKSFKNLDNASVKELVREVIIKYNILSKIFFIIHFFLYLLA